MKIKLRKPKPYPPPYDKTVTPVAESFPFCISRNGILIHRVRSAQRHRWQGQFSHTSIHYWCGNIGREEGLLELPPENRLLCTACEAKAVKAGEKAADELAGRHVHLGRLRPEKVCCTDNKN